MMLRLLSVCRPRKPMGVCHKVSSARTLSTLNADVERDLMKKKRVMTRYYNKQEYKPALENAIKLQDATANALGRDNTIYASSVNNVALMNKMLGNNSVAMNLYTDALHIYGKVDGRDSVSYASTLSNLGVLYRTMAMQSKGMEKLQFLEQSEEALTDARNIRMRRLGDTHRDTIFSCLHLAGTLRLVNKTAEAESVLRSVQMVARGAYGDEDTTYASVLNSLGLLLKNTSRYDEAKECYMKAIKIQTDVLGEAHPEAVTTRSNLAELFIAMGDETQAREVHEHVLELLEVDPDDIVEEDTSVQLRDDEEAARKEEASINPFSEALVPSSSSGGGDSGDMSDVDDDDNWAAQAHRRQKAGVRSSAPRSNARRAHDDDEGADGQQEQQQVIDMEQDNRPPPPPLTFASRKSRPKRDGSGK